MPLRGELDSVDLAHVFQMLVLNEKAGVLEILHEGAKRQLYFGPEGVRIRFERDLVSERVIHSFVRSGRVKPAELERARCNIAVSRKDVLDSLVEIAVLTEDERNRALRAELEEDIYELFFLSGATFEFRESDIPPGVSDSQLALSAPGLIMEAARRVDEWAYLRQLVHSGTDIFERTGDLSAFAENERSPELCAVHASLDGFVTVDEVISRTGICRFLMFRQLGFLIERGGAVKVAATTLVDRGQELMSADRLQSAVFCFEQAIEQDVKDVAVHSRLGQCLESLGQISSAAQRYFEAGSIAEDTGDIDSAIRLFLRVRQLLPTRIDARLHLFELRKIVASHAERHEYEAEAEGSELVRVLHELGRRDDVRRVLAGLVDHAGEDAAVLERVAEVAGVVGQPAFAVDALLLARNQRRHLGDLKGALHCNRRAQALDPSRADLADHARTLQSAIFDRRGRRRSTVRAVAMVAGFAVFFVGYGNYSKAALDAYGMYSLEDFLASKDFEAGRRHYDAIRSGYPLTIPFLLAAEKLREIEVHERHSAEIEEYRLQVQGEQSAINLKQARSLRDAALEARHTGDYQKSLEMLRRAKEYSGNTDPLGLDEAIPALEEYLAGGARLRTEATFYRNAGRIAEAHERLVDLLDRYPNSPDAENILLPVRIDSQPEGATIKIDGVALRIGDGQFTVEAETPFVVDVAAGRTVELELTKEGFAPYTTRVDPAATNTFTIALPQRPPLEAILPRSVAQPFSFAENEVFVALESGRVTALDAATLEVKWTRELPDLAEVSAPLLVLDRSILVPATTRRLFVLSRTDGSVEREILLPEKPESSPVATGKNLAIRCSGGRLAIGAFDASSLDLVPMPCAATLGPLELPEGRLAIACDDGRTWVRAADGTLSLLRSSDVPIGRVTALVTDRETIWVGDATGALFAFDAIDQSHRCSVRAFDGLAIDRISPDLVLPAVSANGRIAVIDCKSNRVQQVLDENLTLAESIGTYLGAIGVDGTVRILSRDGLHPVASFATGEKLLSFGTVSGSHGWFAGAGGRILGVGTLGTR